MKIYELPPLKEYPLILLQEPGTNSADLEKGNSEQDPTLPVSKQFQSWKGSIKLRWVTMMVYQYINP